MAIPANAVPIGIGTLAAIGLVYSRNADAWLLCLGSLWAMLLCIGGRKTHPIFWWFIILSWSRVFASVALADVRGLDLADIGYEKSAIVYSLIALFFIACGIRFGFKTVKSAKEEYGQSKTIWTPTLRQVFLVYLCGFPFFAIVSIAAHISEGGRQILGSFLILKLVLLYCLAATVYRDGRGYFVLIIVLAVEIVLGFTGFFSAFKEPLIIAFIATLFPRPGERMQNEVPFKRYVTTFVLASLIVLLALIWTGMKGEYREWLNEGTGSQVVLKTLPERLEWLSDKLVNDNLINGNFNYGRAAESLLSRIAYTHFYAMVLGRVDAGFIPSQESTWQEAVKRILMPRLLFPDKPVINDSEVTERLTGVSTNRDTSISVGYIAETHVDFGFPLMLIPLFGIGLAMGRVARAFANMVAPIIIRDGFICAAIVGAFGFETNVDKAIAGFILSCGALAVSAWLGRVIWRKGMDRPIKRLLVHKLEQ